MRPTAIRAIALLALTALSFRAAGEPPSESPNDGAPSASTVPGTLAASPAQQGGNLTSELPTTPGSTTIPGASATPGATTVPAPSKTPLLIPEPAWSPRPPRAAAVAPPTNPTTTAASASQPALFSSEAKWDLAGYNNDEVIYTIFITSRDPRIIRCTAVLSGFFYENGEKHSVSDRQSTTVFPQQRVQAGNWQGMDKESGVNYSVKCHPA